ncbi:MAG: hypothetical protein A2Z99_17630 [Treponema sp. GWB1_62_6]|nr:MAG: hypothetical protein A2001_00875 [Treponema sp. GWC1_61_84]OHE65122.1 MAG: hypothetical protein A2Y36_18860 [Treponema sp. GWA1_62_8]OHE69259.1 MAG: hypothetical protein A2413_08875 [Treponema sp. RIFOXYC1_FULL_61_9]OHE72188.1 MAG: hypothetical protein A2Z99_17630 [Treponema sp. GWB1_62_6]HCM28005.1 hypothetical protein [Treponema sp.]
MPSQERKTVLDLPLKVVLTEEGTTVFIRQKKKLTKFKLADDVEEYGLHLEKFVPSAVQRLLLIDYVSKIEISRAEFVTIRQEVMDLSKLIVYGLLYRQYDSTLFARILSSDVIKRWNRANPASALDEKTRFNDGFLQSFLLDKEKAIAEIKAELLLPLREVITKNSNLLPDEMNVQLFLSEKFLNNLRPITWFILAKFRGVDGYEAIARNVRSCLSEYMEKSRIAEYVALMIIELAVNAENSNLRREAAILHRGVVDPNAVLFDPNIRRKVVEELVKKGELVYISWKLGGRSSSIGTAGKLQVILYNKEMGYKEFKDSIESKKSVDLKKKSLMDFYREMPDGGADIELGLYYLSYLNEACEKVGVKFESLVSHIKSSDTTVITLTFNI